MRIVSDGPIHVSAYEFFMLASLAPSNQTILFSCVCSLENVTGNDPAGFTFPTLVSEASSAGYTAQWHWSYVACSICKVRHDHMSICCIGFIRSLLGMMRIDLAGYRIKPEDIYIHFSDWGDMGSCPLCEWYKLWCQACLISLCNDKPCASLDGLIRLSSCYFCIPVCLAPSNQTLIFLCM